MGIDVIRNDPETGDSLRVRTNFRVGDSLVIRPLSDTSRFTFEQRPDTESLEPILATVLHGDVSDPIWRAQMRDLLTRCSPGPFDVSSGDSRFDPETVVVVTNPRREVLAKCGPVRNARSCFDTILFAAAANAIRTLLDRTDTK